MNNIIANIRKNIKKILVFLVIVFLIPNICIMWKSFEKTSEISEKKVAIVFGAAARFGKPSDIFADRLRVAERLYKQKKIQKILISGDNKTHDYNEPQAGKTFLIAHEIPKNDIILDYAGFRTYDTCMRAKKIFGVDEAYLVTQQFHLPRAIFLCEHFGIKSKGVSASLQNYRGMMKNLLRETLAQQKAFYEVYLFSHPPKFLGKEEFIFDK